MNEARGIVKKIFKSEQHLPYRTDNHCMKLAPVQISSLEHIKNVEELQDTCSAEAFLECPPSPSQDATKLASNAMPGALAGSLWTLPLTLMSCASAKNTLELGNCSLSVEGFNIDEADLGVLVSLIQDEADFVLSLVDNEALCQAESLRIEVFDDDESLPLYNDDGSTTYFAGGEYQTQSNQLTINIRRVELDALLASADPINHAVMYYRIREIFFHELGHAVSEDYYESSDKKVWLSTFADQTWAATKTCDADTAYEYQHDCWTRTSDDPDDYWGKQGDLMQGMDSAAEDWATTFATTLMTIRSTQMCYTAESIGSLYADDDNPTDVAKEKYDYMLYLLAQTASDGNAADTLLSYQSRYTPPVDASDETVPAECLE